MLEKQFDVHNGILILTLDRPEKFNALSDALLSSISEELEKADTKKEVKSVILYGGENCFAAGADIQELINKYSNANNHDVRTRYWQHIVQFKKPLIAAVNGYALGAGCELAMHCDIIVAGFNAQFAQPEIVLGIMPGAGGSQKLLRLSTHSLAMQMLLSGDSIDAITAKRSGLVSEITIPERTLYRAQRISKRIAVHSPLAIQTIKQSALLASDTTLTDGLRAERQSFMSLMLSSDAKEGISAFLEKRQPFFTGS